MVNKQPLQPSQSTQSTPVNQLPAIDALKRKFQRVNQEIVKQNVLLQEQAARIRQENHRLLQENVKIKSRANALESKLREAESICTETKKSIAGRIEILEAIGEHLISVTKFLRILSEDNTADDEAKEDKDTQIFENFIPPARRATIKPGKLPMHSIIEEDDVRDITAEIGDVSLIESVSVEKEEEVNENKRKRK